MERVTFAVLALLGLWLGVAGQTSPPTLAAAVTGDEPFRVAAWFDLTATFLFAVTGAELAARKGYDFVGLFGLALVTGLGGGLLRDGLFIQGGPPAAATDGRYLAAVVLGTAFSRLGPLVLDDGSFRRLALLLDAVALGAYASFGAQKSLWAGLSFPAAALVGVVNAVGGGLLRDVVARQEPEVFQPGQLYATAALGAAAAFVGLVAWGGVPPAPASLAAVAVAVLLRLLSLRWDVRTAPLPPSSFR